tara:strand:- start:20 stop:226 length:207 start_codon:yes stop_codon:yes gene_type:complete
MAKIKCKNCDKHIATSRHVVGFKTCLKCGEEEAKKVMHCIVPMHKSNYVVVTRLEDLKGINNKGGIIK